MDFQPAISTVSAMTRVLTIVPYRMLLAVMIAVDIAIGLALALMLNRGTPSIPAWWWASASGYRGTRMRPAIW